MLIGMNRFLTRSDIERLYQIPAAVLPTVMAGVAVVHRDDDGEPSFIESHVDRAVDALAVSAAGRQPPTCDPAPKGKPGRRNTTADIALVVSDLKAQYGVVFAGQEPRACGGLGDITTNKRAGRAGTAASLPGRSRPEQRLNEQRK
jgi:hypothetical protein